MHLEDRQRVAADFRDAVASGREWDFECRIRRADGRERWIWARGGHRPDPEGRPARLTGLVQDVTDRKRLELELQDANVTLERRVLERTSELEDSNAALAAFAEFTEAVGNEPDVPALASRAVEVVERALGADAVAYYELESNLWRATAVSAGTDPVTRAAAVAGVPTDAPLFAAARLEPTFLDGGAVQEGAPEAVIGEVIREYTAAAAVPVVADGALRGLLVVGLKSGRFWQERDRAVVRAVARGLMVVLERAEAAGRLAAQAAEVEARNRALAAFAAFTDAVGTETAVAALADRALAVVSAALVEDVHAVYWELEGDTWKGRVWSGNHRPDTIELFQQGIAESTPTHRDIMATPEVVFFDGWTPDPEYRESAEGYPAAAGVRLLADGQAPAILGFALSTIDRWSDEARAVVRSVARALLIAVQRGRDAALLEAQAAALEARARALAAFADLTEAAGAETDPAALGERFHPVIDAAVGDAGASYWELRGDAWYGVAWWGHVNEATARTLREGIPESTPEHRAIVAADGEPVFFNGWAPDPGYRGGGDAFGAAAGLLVRPDGRSPGILGLGLHAKQAFSAADRAVVGAAYRALWLAVERGGAVARLERQRAELEARNAEQETFVYTVSHDLRQPLLALQGMSELLVEAVELGDEGQAGYMASRVTRNVERMGRLLDDLLALSRAGRELQLPAPLDVRDTLRTVLAELEPRVRAGGVIVEERLAECPQVLYPRSEAEQVLSNLLSNAVKFAGRPGEPPRVLVTCGTSDDRVLVRVEDNGPGIAPEHRERVFGLFQRLDAKAEGNGVGLAIVKRIAERHGGSVALAGSSLGGASFEVTLPADRRQHAAPLPHGHDRRRAP